MSESYIKTQMGELNEDSYASIIKIERPTSAVVILKHECTVIVYDAHALSHGSLVVREAISDLDLSASYETFLSVIGQCAKSVFTDPIFRQRDPKKFGRIVLPVFTTPIDREKLSEFAQGSLNGYRTLTTPPSKHLKPRYK